jgi:hypothetical protein
MYLYLKVDFQVLTASLVKVYAVHAKREHSVSDFLALHIELTYNKANSKQCRNVLYYKIPKNQ